MRTRLEIQRAHDVLWAYVTTIPEEDFDDPDTFPWRSALETLCWILEHDGGNQFERNIETLIKHWKQEGGEIVFDGTERLCPTIRGKHAETDPGSAGKQPG